jgi:O-antigen ligase/polysaccharide polymerase Wzy-like membrane protein
MTDPALWLLGAGLALAPFLPIPYVSDRTLIAARDYWLLGGLAVAAVWLATRGELWLAAMAIYFLCRWRSPALLPHLLTWVAIAGTWFGALAVVPVVRRWLPLAFCFWAGWQIGLVGWNRWVEHRRRPTGSMGSPVLTACFVALTVPFWVDTQIWWTWPMPALGLLLTHSWLAFLAAGAGLCVLAPVLTLPAALLALLGTLAASRRWLTWTPRDNSFKSIRARWNVLPMTWALWRQGEWRWGAGPDTFQDDARRYRARTGRIVPAGDAHNEVLQMGYEYGILGALACLLLVWRVVPHLRLEDPWSAAWVAGALIACGSFPARHVPLGLTWLAITAGVVTR